MIRLKHYPYYPFYGHRHLALVNLLLSGPPDHSWNKYGYYVLTKSNIETFLYPFPNKSLAVRALDLRDSCGTDSQAEIKWAYDEES